MPYFVYILECCDNTYYCGITIDLDKRVYAHNNLKAGAKYTSIRRPVILIYSEICEDVASAMKRERQIKSLTRMQKQKLISANISV